MKTLRDFNFREKKVLVRVDFNVPFDQKRRVILDDFRIKKALPTINYLRKKKAKIILISHLDRPGGKVVESLRLAPIGKRLEKYLKVKIKLASDCLGKEVEKKLEELKGGEILLLENLRFHSGEEEGKEDFARALAKLGDIYIEEAFSCCHRSHASIVLLPKYLPSGIGFLMEKEIQVLSKLLKEPKKPLVAIIAGKKVETKSKVINKLSKIADQILIGGLIKDYIDKERIILEHPEKIISPLDKIDTFDIGPKTIKLYKEKIAQAKTVFWSGPLGMIEKKEFSRGSKEIAKAIVKGKCYSIAGGGETVEFINKLGLGEKFGYLSTGGGAMLEFISNEKLPGIEALK